MYLESIYYDQLLDSVLYTLAPSSLSYSSQVSLAQSILIIPSYKDPHIFVSSLALEL